MQKHILISFVLFTMNLVAQKDSLNVKSHYWEDQLYINVTYNIMNDQPKEISSSEFSYGVSFGYIKDIPLNKDNTFALGLGLGYNYDLFTHDLVYNDDGFSSSMDDIGSNKLKLHNLEFPIQIRWRTSDAVTYSFWRVYLGVKMNYNLLNKFSYTLSNQDLVFKNIKDYNNFQTGLELSVGYGALNFYTYYGLSPLYENALLDNTTKIDTKVLKLGFIFYLL